MKADEIIGHIDRACDETRWIELYVHIPFCRYKCHFCDWVSAIPTKRLRSTKGDRSGYLKSLCKGNSLLRRAR